MLGSPYALSGFINGKSVSIVRDNPEDKALLATFSIAEAIEYYKLFEAHAPQLKVSALFDPNIDNNAGVTVKCDAMAEILTDYRCYWSVSAKFDIIEA